MDWTDDNVIRLINEYRERQCLWDPATPHYKMMNKKNDAWTDIANTLGCDVEEVKKKMNSLLASFRRERAKERKKRFTSGSDEVVRTSTWFAFRHLSFLLDKFTSRDTNKSTEVSHEKEKQIGSYTPKTSPNPGTRRRVAFSFITFSYILKLFRLFPLWWISLCQVVCRYLYRNQFLCLTFLRYRILFKVLKG